MADFPTVKLLIIDLDNTLCDTFHTLSKPQWEKVAQVLESRGYAKHAAVFRKNLGKKSFRKIIEDLKIPEQERKLAMRAYDSLDVKRLKLYDDAHALLDLPHEKVLVTRGDRSLQLKKIRHLKLSRYFAQAYYVPTMERKGAAFRLILKDFKVKPSECLVIGDRVEEEIIEGKRLGMRTALIDRPDWPTSRIVKPDLTAKSLERIAARLRHV